MGQGATSAVGGCSFSELRLCAENESGQGGLVLPSRFGGSGNSHGRIFKSYSLDVSGESRFPGTSTFGTCFRAVPVAAPAPSSAASSTRVVRVVPKHRCERDALTRELEVLRIMEHPNLVRVLEVVEDPRTVSVVMEHVSGEGLFAAVASQGRRLSEYLVAHLAKQMLLGLQQLHSAGLAHQNMQPRNVLAAEAPGPPGQEVQVKLIDYGLADKHSKDRAGSARGWRPCLAPEQIPATAAGVAPSGPGEAVDPRCDVWTVGVLAHAMLSGFWPMEALSPQSLRVKIRAGRWSLAPAERWLGVGQDAQAFLTALMVPEVQDRPMAGHALGHPFLQLDALSKSSLRALPRFVEISHSLRRLDAWPAVHQALVDALATQLTMPQLSDFRQHLEAEAGSGREGLSLAKVRRCLVRAGVSVQGRFLKHLSAVEDGGETLGVSSGELVEAAAERRKGLEEAILWVSWYGTTADNAAFLRRDDVPRVLRHASPLLRQALGATSAAAAIALAVEQPGCLAQNMAGASPVLDPPQGHQSAAPVVAFPEQVSFDDLLSGLRAASASATPPAQSWLRTSSAMVLPTDLVVRMPPPPQNSK